MNELEATLDDYKPIPEEIIEKFQLKLARYECTININGSEIPFRDADGIVVYKIFHEDRVVIYSGLTSRGLSTINAAEKIIKLIQEKEKLLPSAFRFFDVQTKAGYPEGPHLISEITLDNTGLAHFRNYVDLSEMPEGFFME